MTDDATPAELTPLALRTYCYVVAAVGRQADPFREKMLEALRDGPHRLLDAMHAGVLGIVPAAGGADETAFLVYVFAEDTGRLLVTIDARLLGATPDEVADFRNIAAAHGLTALPEVDVAVPDDASELLEEPEDPEGN